MATQKKMKLGSQTAKKGLTPTFVAATVVIFMLKMYINATTNPINIWKPVPPLDFLPETETAIRVKIKAATG